MEHDVRERMAAAGGQKLNAEDAKRLVDALPALRLAGLCSVWSDAPITGAYLSLSEEQDASGLGVEMQWMTVDEVLDEARAATPGIQAVRLGLLPVGKCLLGSGDPYFVDTRVDGCPLVRVPHAAVDAHTDTLDQSRIESVSSSLSTFFAQCKIGLD